MNGGSVFILSGPSAGVGKDTLIDLLAAYRPSLAKARTWTTRTRRENEAEDAYVFATREEFLAAAERGEFLEHAEFNGRLYGCHRPTIEAMAAEGRTVVLRIEVQGHALAKAAWPELRSVFILPPSMAELERRIRGRAQDSEENVVSRLRLAVDEIARCVEYDHMIVNDDLFEATAKLGRFVDRVEAAWGTQAA